MHTPSSWPDDPADGTDDKEAGDVKTSQSNSNSTISRKSSGTDNGFMKYLRPMTPPMAGCYMDHRSPCDQYRMPHPPGPHPHYHLHYAGHYPMVPVYYPHGPPRFPPHMMVHSRVPYRHPHMGYIPSPPVPPYPNCYPYQYNTRSRFGSPRVAATPSTHSWNEYKYAMQKSIPQR